MIECATREDAKALVGKALCSVFLAVDGTITLRRENLPDAANAISSCLASHGLIESSADVEKVIFAFLQRDGEKTVPVSVPAGDVASRICTAICPQQLAP